MTSETRTPGPSLLRECTYTILGPLLLPEEAGADRTRPQRSEHPGHSWAQLGQAGCWPSVLAREDRSP